MGFVYRDGRLVDVSNDGQAAGETTGGNAKARRPKAAAKTVTADQADGGGNAKARRSKAAAKAKAGGRDQAKPRGHVATTRPTTKTTNRKRGQRRLHPSGSDATDAHEDEDPEITVARTIWTDGLVAQRRQKEARRREAEQSVQHTAEARALWEVANSTQQAQDGKRHRAEKTASGIDSAAELWRSSRADSGSEGESPGEARSTSPPHSPLTTPKTTRQPSAETAPGKQRGAPRYRPQGRTAGEKRRNREAQLQLKVIIQWKRIQGRHREQPLTKFVIKEAMKEPSDEKVYENMKELRVGVRTAEA